MQSNNNDLFEQVQKDYHAALVNKTIRRVEVYVEAIKPQNITDLDKLYPVTKLFAKKVEDLYERVVKLRETTETENKLAVSNSPPIKTVDAKSTIEKLAQNANETVSDKHNKLINERIKSARETILLKLKEQEAKLKPLIEKNWGKKLDAIDPNIRTKARPANVSPSTASQNNKTSVAQSTVTQFGNSKSAVDSKATVKSPVATVPVSENKR